MTKIKINQNKSFHFYFPRCHFTGNKCKKYTHAVDDEQHPILARLTEGKFLKPVAERN